MIVGGECDSWDLEVRGGFLGGARLLCAVEEHGAGCQTVRYRLWPHVSCVSLVLGVALGLLAVAAGFDGAWQAAAGLGGSAILLVYRVLVESATSISALLAAAEER